MNREQLQERIKTLKQRLSQAETTHEMQQLEAEIEACQRELAEK